MFRNTRNNVAYFVIFAAAFLLFFSQPRILIPLKNNLIDVTSLPLKILSFPIKEIKKIIFYHRTFEEYKRLSTETAVLKSRLIGMEEIIKENNRLDKLLNLKRKLVFSSIPANVIGRDPSYWNSAVIIDKGSRDGVKQGQAVVSAFGVVGKIIEAGKTKAKVILLTDPQFSVAGLVEESHDSVLVRGTLEGMCQLEYLSDDAHINVGDKIITSKLSTSFPEGLLIGEVVRIDEKFQEQKREYILKPSVPFSQLEELLVIQK